MSIDFGDPMWPEKLGAALRHQAAAQPAPVTMSKAREALAAIFDHALACGVRAEQHEYFSTGSFAAKRYRKEAEAARDALLDAALATPEPEAAPAAPTADEIWAKLMQLDDHSLAGVYAAGWKAALAAPSPKPSQAGPVQGEAHGLLRRASAQLSRWHEKYGQWQPAWLPPAGDVRLQEDIDDLLASSEGQQPGGAT